MLFSRGVPPLLNAKGSELKSPLVSQAFQPRGRKYAPTPPSNSELLGGAVEKAGSSVAHGFIISSRAPTLPFPCFFSAPCFSSHKKANRSWRFLLSMVKPSAPRAPLTIKIFYATKSKTPEKISPLSKNRIFRGETAGKFLCKGGCFKAFSRGQKPRKNALEKTETQAFPFSTPLTPLCIFFNLIRAQAINCSRLYIILSKISVVNGQAERAPRAVDKGNFFVILQVY